MKRIPTLAALTGGLLVTGAVVAGGIALAGEDRSPAPTPAFVTVDEPANGQRVQQAQGGTGEKDCPGDGGPGRGAPSPEAPAAPAAPVSNL